VRLKSRTFACSHRTSVAAVPLNIAVLSPYLWSYCSLLCWSQQEYQPEYCKTDLMAPAREIPAAEPSSTDSGRAGGCSLARLGPHSCSHCEREIINADNKDRADHVPDLLNKFWYMTLKHDVDEIAVAASDSCPLFGWLDVQIKASKTPLEQLRRTKITIRFELGDTSSSAVQPRDFRNENSAFAAVHVATENYSWQVGPKFEVFSRFCESIHG
jgi:hypothetical protein